MPASIKRRSPKRRILLATLLLAVSALVNVSAQTSGVSMRFPPDFTCDDVEGAAFAYFESHGVYAFEQRGMTTSDGIRFNGIAIHGRTATPGGVGQRWIDAQGNNISDFKVYWGLSNRKETPKLPFGVWHLRLGRYRPEGEMKLIPGGEGCSVDLLLRFAASGALMVGILGLDSQWSLGSNGGLEREYLDGITTELKRRGPSPPKPPDPEVRF